jgi:hypothetical protein
MTKVFNQSDYKTFEFDWTGIDPEYQWVALDKNGTVSVFNNRPVWGWYPQGEWVNPDSDDCKRLQLTSLGMQDSSLHIMKRPTEAL